MQSVLVSQTHSLQSSPPVNTKWEWCPKAVIQASNWCAFQLSRHLQLDPSTFTMVTRPRESLTTTVASSLKWKQVKKKRTSSLFVRGDLSSIMDDHLGSLLQSRERQIPCLSSPNATSALPSSQSTYSPSYTWIRWSAVAKAEHYQWLTDCSIVINVTHPLELARPRMGFPP